MSITNRLDTAIAATISCYNMTPNYIYMGAEEMQELKDWAEAQGFYMVPQNKVTEVYYYRGISVIEVKAESHLNIAYNGRGN